MFLKGQTIEALEFCGLQVLDYTSSIECSSSLAIVNVPPRNGYPAACSERSEKLYFIARGTVSFTIGDDVATLNAGDACLVRRGTVFSYHNYAHEAACLVLCHTPSFDGRYEVLIDTADQK